MNTTDSVPRRLDPQVSLKGLDAAFATLDPNRASGYAQLGRARSAKSASLVREQKLLALKHGTAGSPRAHYAAQALTRNEQLRGELAASREVLETPPPSVDENSFVLHGFVRRRNQSGIPGLTLALTDAQGNWLKDGGYACTDQRGYFELRIERPAKTDEELKKEAAAKAEAERKAAAEAAATVTDAVKSADTQSTGGATRINSNQTAATRTGYQLRVFNRDGRVLHIEERLVTPQVNTVDYRLIILGDEDCGCTPPPEKSDGEPGPKSPRSPVAPPAAPVQPSTTSVAPRVTDLKSYTNPTATSPSGQPLEAIRGIGPKRAATLRSAGIDDVAEFEKTEGAALVKLAGFDKTPPKPTAAQTPQGKNVAGRSVAARPENEKNTAALPLAEKTVPARTSGTPSAAPKTTETRGATAKAAPAKTAKKAAAKKPLTSKAKKSPK